MASITDFYTVVVTSVRILSLLDHCGNASCTLGRHIVYRLCDRGQQRSDDAEKQTHAKIKDQKRS